MAASALLCAACNATALAAIDSGAMKGESQVDPGPVAPAADNAERIAEEWRAIPGFRSVQPYRRVPGYQHISLHMQSPSNQRPIPASVFVPPQYLTRTDARFPVIYVLQVFDGYFGQCRSFLRDHPTILVTWSSSHPAPDRKGGKDSGWWIDSTRRPKCQLETFFFDELHPLLRAHFRIQDKVGITGFSSGGYAAHLYMLRKPEMFASVSSIDARYFAAGYGGTMHTHISRWYGPYNDETKKHHDAHSLPLLLKAHLEKQTKLPPLFTTVGTRDYLLGDNRRWVRLLSDLNRKLIFELAGASGYKKDPDPAQMSIFDLRPFMRRDYFKKHYPARCVDYEYLEVDGVHSVARGIMPRVFAFHWRHFAAPALPARSESACSPAKPHAAARGRTLTDGARQMTVRSSDRR